MQKLSILILLAISSTSALADLTDAEAKYLAEEAVEVMDNARKNFNVTMKDLDKKAYLDYTKNPLVAAINAWPIVHLKNKASFPYFQCKQMFLDYLQYSDAYLASESYQANREKLNAYYMTYTKAYISCKMAIKQPDMSLKELQ